MDGGEKENSPLSVSNLILVQPFVNVFLGEVVLSALFELDKSGVQSKFIVGVKEE